MIIRATLRAITIGAILAVAPVGGHDLPTLRPGHGSWRPTLVSAHQPAPGVRIALLPGRVPGMFLESSAADPVLIYGRYGEPFLRFSRHGVEANLQSPLWQDNARARGETIGAAADPRAAPEWRRVSSVARFGWIEFRAWPGTDEPLPGAREGRVPPPRVAWSVPMRIGNRPISLLGLTSWHPARP